jgi:hypothetical protein
MKVSPAPIVLRKIEVSNLLKSVQGLDDFTDSMTFPLAPSTSTAWDWKMIISEILRATAPSAPHVQNRCDLN